MRIGRAVPQQEASSVVPAARAPGVGMAARRGLLAAQGSGGARAAQAAIIQALSPGAHLHHLVVVEEFWRHMSGDGWRINASTEHIFCDYLEGQIERETLEILERAHVAVSERGIGYSASSRCGPLAACVLAEAADRQVDLVVIGAPRPKGMRGLRSRMDVEALMRGLSVPLMVVPHPRAKTPGRNGR